MWLSSDQRQIRSVECGSYKKGMKREDMRSVSLFLPGWNVDMIAGSYNMIPKPSTENGVTTWERDARPLPLWRVCSPSVSRETYNSILFKSILFWDSCSMQARFTLNDSLMPGNTKNRKLTSQQFEEYRKLPHIRRNPKVRQPQDWLIQQFMEVEAPRFWYLSDLFPTASPQILQAWGAMACSLNMPRSSKSPFT